MSAITEMAGPDQVRFECSSNVASARAKGPRKVVADAHARYFGTELSERVAGSGARLGKVHFEDWLSQPGPT